MLPQLSGAMVIEVTGPMAFYERAMKGFLCGTRDTVSSILNSTNTYYMVKVP